MNKKTNVETDTNILHQYINFVAKSYNLDSNETELLLFTLIEKQKTTFNNDIINELATMQIKKAINIISEINAQYIDKQKFQNMTTAKKFLIMYENFQKIVQDVNDAKRKAKKELRTIKNILEARKRLKKRGLINYKKGKYYLNIKHLKEFAKSNEFTKSTDNQRVIKKSKN